MTMEPIRFSEIEAIRGWEEFLSDGEGYLKTAVAAFEKKKKSFTAEILYNMIAMAIEKFVMAALMRYGAMPYNHTMRDLVEAMDETFPGKMKMLREGLLSLDKYQEICDLDTYRISPPGMKEIPGMIDLAKNLEQLIHEEILSKA